MVLPEIKFGFARYDGPGNGYDAASALAIDATGNVYVTGASRQDSGSLGTATVKYTQSPSPAFVRTLFFPRLDTDPNQSTGIAIVNLDSTVATLQFTAFERTGSEVGGSNISNPAIRTLNSGSQIPIIASQIFGEGLTSSRPIGWLKVESTLRKIAGFFLMFDPALNFLDGADVSSGTLTSFVFPEVETSSEGFTQIHIANANANSIQTSLELVRTDGSVRARAERAIQANGSVADMLTDLFPGVTPSASDYIRATASQGVSAFEFLGRAGRFVEGLNGQDTASGATILYSPQYVVGGPTWMSTLSVVNLDQNGGTVTFRFIGDDGAVIGTQQRPILPRGKLFISEQSFFSSSAPQKQGYIEITSSGPRLSGSVVFGDQSRSTFSSSLPLVANLHREMIFGQVASAEQSSPAWFMGLALLNTGSANANATVQVFDEYGLLVKSGNFLVPARRRLSQLLTQYFPDLAGRDILKGYLRVTTDQPLASFAIFGTTSLSVLSAVPPQLVP